MGKSPFSSWVRSVAGRRMSRSLGPAHVTPALHDEELGLLPAQVEPPAMQDAAVDDEIVALAEREVAEYRLQRAPSLAHVHQLVRLRVAVEVRVVLVGLDVEHGHFVVEEERHPIEGRAPAFLHLRGAEVPVPQRMVGVGLVLRFPEAPRRLHRGGRMDVIEQRGGSGEPLVSHQLLGVDPAIGLAEGDVALPGDLAHGVIDRHVSNSVGRAGGQAVSALTVDQETQRASSRPPDRPTARPPDLTDSRAAPAPARSPRTAP
jgi:hypothetical protein